jgi:hypothetical protein
MQDFAGFAGIVGCDSDTIDNRVHRYGDRFDGFGINARHIK